MIREKLGDSLAEKCEKEPPEFLIPYYAEALYLEEREIDRTAAAIAKAFGAGQE